MHMQNLQIINGSKLNFSLGLYSLQRTTNKNEEQFPKKNKK